MDIATTLLAAAALSSLPSDSVPLCLPPKLPFAPSADDEIVRYADLIGADFERYFSAVSDFSTCLIDARQAIIEQGRAVGEDYQMFLDRAARLGVGAKAALPSSVPASEGGTGE